MTDEEIALIKLQDLKDRYETALLHKGPYLTRGGVEVSNWLDSYDVLLCGIGLSWTIDALAERLDDCLTDIPDVNIIAASGKAGAILLGGLLSKWPTMEGALIDTQDVHPRLKLYLSGKCIFPIETRALCIVVEDVCSEGITAIKVIDYLRSLGFDPLLYLTVVYRGLGAKNLIQDKDMSFDYLLYIPEAVSKDHEVQPCP